MPVDVLVFFPHHCPGRTRPAGGKITDIVFVYICTKEHEHKPRSTSHWVTDSHGSIKPSKPSVSQTHRVGRNMKKDIKLEALVQDLTGWQEDSMLTIFDTSPVVPLPTSCPNID